MRSLQTPSRMPFFLVLVGTGLVSFCHADSPPADSVLFVNDTAGTISPADTGLQATGDSIADTLNIPVPDSLVPSSDTIPKNAIPDTATEAKPGAFFSHPFFGFTAAWTLGGFPLFGLWEKDLPRSLGNFGIVSDNVIAQVATMHDTEIVYDTLDLDFTLREAPNTYNLSFPVGVALSFPFDTLTRLSVDAAFMFVQKRFQAVIEADTFDNVVKMTQRFGLYAPWVGLTFCRSIPPQYFTIKNIRHAQLSLGIAASPWALVNRSTTVKQNKGRRGPQDPFQPVLDTLLADYAQRARSLLPEYRTTGYGIAWKTGLSAVRFYSPHAGLEAGLYYVGRFFYFPHSSSGSMANTIVNRTKQPFSFTAHRFVIQVSFLRGRKLPIQPPGTNTDNE